MKHRKFKKGFTLVELVVVIAVIGILAGVSVATYFGVVNSAKRSNDETMVTQMNTALNTEAILNGKFEFAADSIDALNQNGFQGKYKAFSTGYHYGYSLENNKMYLVDNNNNVVYPNSEVKTSDLWFLWDNNATDKVDGATKYIALTNIDDNTYFATHFSEGDYQIDLAGHYINLKTSLTNVKVSNGIYVNGATPIEGEGIIKTEKYDEATLPTTGTLDNPTVIENKVFDLERTVAKDDLDDSFDSAKNITFKNCFFYNVDNIGSRGNNRVFENCTFIDGKKYIFNLQGTGEFSTALTVRNCTFTNCARVFNIPILVTGQKSEGMKLLIEGNTFYGVTGENRSFAQFQFQSTVSKPPIPIQEGNYKLMDITFKDNKFKNISTTQAGLFTLHKSIIIEENCDLAAENNVKFTNNEIDPSISKDKYVVNDDGKPDSAFEKYYGTKLKESLKNKLL